MGSISDQTKDMKSPPQTPPSISTPARTPPISSPTQHYSPPIFSSPSTTPPMIPSPRQQYKSPSFTPPISSPTQYNSPSLSRSPLLLPIDDSSNAPNTTSTPPNKTSFNTPNIIKSGYSTPNAIKSGYSTPNTIKSGYTTPTNIHSHKSTPTRTSRPRTPAFITPIASPLRKALHLTKLDPHDAWLPITESRNGNSYYAAFHTLCSGIGIQALILPLAFAVLGWTWGIISLTLAFIWQLYTLYLLVQLHESTTTGLRYSRYMSLAIASFGDRLAHMIAIFPIMNLSAGTCVALIIIGGSTSKLFFQIVCGVNDCSVKQLSTVEWYLVFTCAAIVLSQLPNLNSIAGVSLLGGVTAFGYCSIIWIVSVSKGRLPGVSYDRVEMKPEIRNFFSVLNALGIIAFAFRGHNLVLEIQGTMPSDEKHPSRVPMWKGTKVAYTLIAMCLFPLAIGGYWAYGHLIAQVQGSMLTALYTFHSQDTSRFILGLTSLLVIVNALSSFNIYGMPTFDDMESKYTIRKKRPCPWWLRSAIRAIFGFICFFIAVAVPFLSNFAGLLGGISLPVTLAYPCFMWAIIKKPKTYGLAWWVNWGLGVFGMVLTVLVSTAGIYSVIDTGVKFKFFHPQ